MTALLKAEYLKNRRRYIFLTALALTLVLLIGGWLTSKLMVTAAKEIRVGSDGEYEKVGSYVDDLLENLMEEMF